MTDRCPHCGAVLKRCAQCERVLPADQFTRSKTSASGLSSWCRTCQRDHRDDPERKARQREVNRARTAARTQQRRDQRSLEERLAALEHKLGDAE